MKKTNSPLPEYVDLYNEKQRLKKRIKDIDIELARLQDIVLGYLTEGNIDRQTVAGDTVALRRTLWVGRAEDVTAEEFGDALKQHPELSRYARQSCDTQGLSAFVREVERELEEENPEGIPTTEDLKAELESRFPGVGIIVKLTEKFEVSVTKSKKSTARMRAAMAEDELADDDIRY